MKYKTVIMYNVKLTDLYNLAKCINVLFALNKFM